MNIPYAGGPAIKTFVVYPERRDKASVVIVIHEIFGLTDWIRGVAEQLAEDGYIAVAPDLLSGMGPGGGGTAEIGGDDAARKVIAGLTPAEATNRINAVHGYAVKIPTSNGRTATVGYCWGGARSFEAAVNQPELDAAIVFYGTSPANAGDLAKIKAPVLGLYGADDARVNATIEPASAEMKRLGRPTTSKSTRARVTASCGRKATVGAPTITRAKRRGPACWLFCRSTPSRNRSSERTCHTAPQGLFFMVLVSFVAGFAL